MFFWPKQQFSQILLLDREKKIGKKKLPYPNKNSPLFGPIVKNVLEVVHDNIAYLAWYRKWFFFFKFWTQKITDSQWGHLG